MRRSARHPTIAMTLACVVAAVATGCADDAGEATENGPGTAAATSAVGAEPALADILAEVRAAAERFQDVEVALAEGYIRDPMNVCETADLMGLPPERGAMGLHYFRPDLLAITATEPRIDGVGTHTDFLEPSVLLYEPRPDGSLELVGVENLVFAEAWWEAGNDAPPSFAGIPYEYMENDPGTQLDEAHMFEPHFDRHVWVFRDNPNGVFDPFNPAVTCEHHDAVVAHAH